MVPIGFYWFLLISIDFYWFLLVSIGFYWFLLVSIGFYWFCIGFYWFLSVSIGFYWLSIGFYWFLLVSIGFYWFHHGVTPPPCFPLLYIQVPENIDHHAVRGFTCFTPLLKKLIHPDLFWLLKQNLKSSTNNSKEQSVAGAFKDILRGLGKVLGGRSRSCYSRCNKIKKEPFLKAAKMKWCVTRRARGAPGGGLGHTGSPVVTRSHKIAKTQNISEILQTGIILVW